MRHISIILLSVLFTYCETKDNIYVDFDAFCMGTILSLKAYIHDDTDCGEWGGHEEVIQIGKVNDTLRFFYIRDSTKCAIEAIRIIPLPPNVKTRHQGLLTDEMKKLVRDYIDELYFYKPDRGGVSNAADTYSVEFNSEHYNKELKIYPVIDWSKYIELRDKMIND